MDPPSPPPSPSRSSWFLLFRSVPAGNLIGRPLPPSLKPTVVNTRLYLTRWRGVRLPAAPPATTKKPLYLYALARSPRLASPRLAPTRDHLLFTAAYAAGKEEEACKL